jgi:hypothetical protein
MPRWRDIVAMGPSLALLLAVAGTIPLVLDVFLVRPEIVRFSTEGRLVIGRVTRSPPLEVTNGNRYKRNHSGIAVDDPELGPQGVDVYGNFPLGQHVPMFCLTSANRCLSVDDVKARVDMWPFTPLMLSGIICMTLAAMLGLTTLLHRRRHAIRR